MSFGEFVEGWEIAQVLGEGAFGEVKLLVNRKTSEAVAMKLVDLRVKIMAYQEIRKEIAIHRLLTHDHVLKFFGSREEEKFHYIFLEYAAGGELFDRIEPDVGMDHALAQRYFQQLISGVEYLHTRGIAHRDLKPENLLLDEHDNLKISDFGFATIFRYLGQERLLDKKCGTLPYIAPEVLVKKYNAQPADIWSCGVILVTLLAGELPWDKPSPQCKEFADWKKRKDHQPPWKKIDTLALALLRRILSPRVDRRYTISQIKLHPWFVKNFKAGLSRSIQTFEDASSSRKRVCSDIGRNSSEHVVDQLCLSQPEFVRYASSDADAGPQKPLPHVSCLSQPACLDDILLNSQLSSGATQTTQNPIQRLVKRMTRFFVSTSAEETATKLREILGKLAFNFKQNGYEFTVTLQDKRRQRLVFKANLLEMNDALLIDFRLSRGCGLEFKRYFLDLKQRLKDITVQVPVSWPLAIAGMSNFS
ncbi:serine/threonine-protein kinase Chk1-like [Tropilaelaps mercedesae]|uniref:non-specific serine/threonine protein kinase n=1 Tax=Tropilaelaps mercedesae TaxID=418985 RepID=A0A1V9XEW3_9ACAR|nr:serine/threonine-protein kinase Chk1-like [Tropilaelaps mercedesae]